MQRARLSGFVKGVAVVNVVPSSAMGRVARKKKMKAVNDLHKYQRGPIVEGSNRAPDAEDLVPEDLPPAFANSAANLQPNTGALSKASQRRLKRTQKEKEKDDGAADGGEHADDAPADEGDGPVVISRPKKERKETPAMILVLIFPCSQFLCCSLARATRHFRDEWIEKRKKSSMP